MVYLVPLANPDGADLAAGVCAPDSPEYRAAAAIAAQYPEVPFPSGWKANLRGVDLNLNYPARWETARRIKRSRASARLLRGISSAFLRWTSRSRRRSPPLPAASIRI